MALPPAPNRARLTPDEKELARRATEAVKLLRRYDTLSPEMALYWVISDDEAEALRKMAA